MRKDQFNWQDRIIQNFYHVILNLKEKNLENITLMTLSVIFFRKWFSSSFSDSVPEPVLYRTLTKLWSQNSQKTTRQKFKIYIHFYRTDFALSEYNFFFQFLSRAVNEKFGFKVKPRHGTRTVREQFRWNYFRFSRRIPSVPSYILSKKEGILQSRRISSKVWPCFL